MEAVALSMSFYDCGLDEFPLPFFYLGPPRFCDFWDKLGLGVFVWACVHAWLNLGPLCVAELVPLHLIEQIQCMICDYLGFLTLIN